MWPHDGRNQTLAGAGESLASQYRDAGLDGGNSVEAGLQAMLDRMRGQRWFVFKGQNDPWMEEARLLHRDERGLLVKEGDDAVSASRYALVGLRHGRTGSGRDFNRPLSRHVQGGS
jgi:hypothetical protein